MTALPILDDATWERMGWRARQQWLLAANALRKQLAADLTARLAAERTRAAFARGVALDHAALTAVFDDGKGEARLAAAVREMYDLPEPKMREPKNARRLDIERIAELLDEQPWVTSTEIGHEFGVTADAVRKHCKRHQRFDLLGRLRENGKVAA